MIKLLELLVDNKGHIAVTETDLIGEEQPAMILAIESLTLMEIKGSRQLCLYLFLLVDSFDIIALHDDSLGCNVHPILFGLVCISLKSPEHIWIEPMIK